MSRIFLTALAAAAITMAPSTLLAQQEPQRTKELKDAERFIASAMVAPDTAEARARLVRALDPLQQAMLKNPDNALVWFTSGQVYVRLDDFARADSAFDKAETLYPPMASDVEGERLRAWNAAFEAGLRQMDATAYPAAIAEMERAESIYEGRPESKLNIGALYAGQGDVVRAEAAYRSALALTKSDAVAALQPQEAADWKRFEGLATMKIAEVLGARGVTAFEAGDYDDAAKSFRDARDLNPYARDYHFNLAQSLFARARDTEDRLAEISDPKSADAKKLAADLLAYYADLEPVVADTRAADPNNEDLFHLLMRSYRVRGDLSADAADKKRFQESSAALMKEHGALPAVISEIGTSVDGGEAAIRGSLRNISVTAGAPIKLEVTLLGIDGSIAGQQEIILKAPAIDEDVAFEGVAKISGDVAGWKYVVK